MVMSDRLRFANPPYGLSSDRSRNSQIVNFKYYAAAAQDRRHAVTMGRRNSNREQLACPRNTHINHSFSFQLSASFPRVNELLRKTATCAIRGYYDTDSVVLSAFGIVNRRPPGGSEIGA